MWQLNLNLNLYQGGWRSENCIQLVMPFGLTNAPAVFQALVNGILRDMLGNCVFGWHMLSFRRPNRNMYSMCGWVPFLGIPPRPRRSWIGLSLTLVSSWNPSIRLANFYRRFIHNYCSVGIEEGIEPLWLGSQSAEEHCFNAAPIFTFPNPAHQFVVEVDASDTGVGAIISQRSAQDERFHPCEFFSERNYVIGNRELLVVKPHLWLPWSMHIHVWLTILVSTAANCYYQYWIQCC